MTNYLTSLIDSIATETVASKQERANAAAARLAEPAHKYLAGYEESGARFAAEARAMDEAELAALAADGITPNA